MFLAPTEKLNLGFSLLMTRPTGRFMRGIKKLAGRIGSGEVFFFFSF